MPVSRRQGLGVWLLFYQIFGVIGLNNIPPATLIITALQVLIFLRIIPVPWHSPVDVCISVDSVWHGKQWIRLLYGALEHGSDWHLYYNMISFVWKGISLERRFGTPKFAYLISVFTALCSATLVALCQLAGEYGGRAYYHQCAVGFSSVIFALKVLTTHYWPHGSHRIMGMPFDLPIRYLVWVELLLIQILVPNSSLLGHLAGILVGLAYVHTPVGHVIDSGWNIIRSIGFDGPRTNRFFSSNRLGGGHSYHEGMTEEEQFEFARQESMRAQYGNRAYSYRPSRQTPPSEYSRPSPFHPSGMTEDEEFEFARQESLRSKQSNNRCPYPETNSAMPSAPNRDYGTPPRTYNSNLPYPDTDFNAPPSTSNGPSLYPNLDDIRRQRLNRFQ